MELSDVRLALRRHWVLAFVVFQVCLALGVAAALLPAKTYRASTTVLVEAGPSANVNPIQYAAFQIPAIIEVVESGGFQERVRETLPSDAAATPVSVRAEAEPGTGVLHIRVSGKEPPALAAWATALGRTIVDDRNTPVAPLPTAGADPDDEDAAAPAAPVLTLTLLDPAAVPSAPVSPKPVPILFASTVLGLLAALLSAVLAHRARLALDVAEEIQRRLGVPVLGEIPPVRKLRRPSESFANAFEAGTPELVEAFQGLRTNLDLALLGAEPEALAVTSWSAGEGKSTVAAGLALTLAAGGKEVVVVDADLRYPNLHTRLDQPFGQGLADVGRIGIEALIMPTRFRGLRFVPAGIPDRHPADVLAAALPAAKNAVVATGRRLIVDAPPLHGVAETPMVLAISGHALLVVDANKAKLLELEHMVTRLRGARVNVVGIVLNRVRRSRQGSAYGAYSPAAERPTVERPAVERPAVERPAVERPAADTTVGWLPEVPGPAPRSVMVERPVPEGEDLTSRS
jgi:capsular exopolysaccharide synthesis family protein